MAKIVFNKEIQKVSPEINEENIINDTIYELLDEDEITTLFRLYDKLKDRISPGTILRNGDDKITILNEAEYKTHAYLIANSKNYLTGDSMFYSIDEVNTLVTQLDALKTRLYDLNSQILAMAAIIKSFQKIIENLNTSLTNVLSSNDNIEIYSKAFVDFYVTLNTFTIDNINNIINALQVEKNEFSLKNYSTITTATGSLHSGSLYGV